MKVDLHLHIDGSFRIETLYDLARNRGIIKDISVDEFKTLVSVDNSCDSLNTYLAKFDIPLQVIQGSDVIYRITYELIEDLYHGGVEVAELRFASATVKGSNTQEEVVKAAIKALNDAKKVYPIRVGIILCAMRGISDEENLETLRLAKAYLDKGVVAFDLAGAEAIYPNQDYVWLFEKANALQVPLTIHAGEAAGRESIEAAINNNAARLGHGIRIVDYKDLMEIVKDKGIVLEICPLSEHHTKAIDEFKLRELYDYGLKLTINTDNMSISSTNLDKEYEFLKQNYGFKDEEIEVMQQNALEASFIKE